MAALAATLLAVAAVDASAQVRVFGANLNRPA
jgi:hypothetical protein